MSLNQIYITNYIIYNKKLNEQEKTKCTLLLKSDFSVVYSRFEIRISTVKSDSTWKWNPILNAAEIRFTIENRIFVAKSDFKSLAKHRISQTTPKKNRISRTAKSDFKLQLEKMRSRCQHAETTAIIIARLIER